MQLVPLAILSPVFVFLRVHHKSYFVKRSSFGFRRAVYHQTELTKIFLHVLRTRDAVLFLWKREKSTASAST